MPSRRKDRGHGLSAAIARAVPTNMRVFAETMFGETAPITEKSFRPEELQAMRAAVMRKQNENADLEDMYRSGSETMNMDTGEWEKQDLSKEIGSFDKSRGRTAISYADYGNAIEEDNGAESSLVKSFTDPEYNVATTLGQYVAFKGEDGTTKIKDTYNWNNVDTSEMSRRDVVKAFMAADNLREMGNAIVHVFKPDVRREVLVDLGMIEEER